MNTQKAIELLELPLEAAAFEGQVRSKISRYIVIDEKYDFTQIVGGKPTITRTWRVGQRTEAFGLYVFNYIANLLHSFSHEIVSASATEIETVKPFTTATVTQGPFAGQTYWYGEQRAYITALGIDLAVTPYQNADVKGFPTNHQTAPTTAGVVYVQQWAKTSKNGQFLPMGSLKVKSYSRQDIEALTGMNESELAYTTRTTFVRTAVDNTQYVTSMALDIEVNGNQIKGVPYINGLKHSDIPNLGSLITSYGKPWPSFIFDWRIYNEAGINAVGSSVSVRFQANEDNTVTVVAGNDDAYDAATKTLTYNAPLDTLAQIVAYIECLPAQGKNENVGRVFYPETGIEVNW